LTDDPLLAKVDEAARAGRLTNAAAMELRGWLAGTAYASQKDAIAALVTRGDWEELQDAFGSVIPFGTGGRRGPMGPGPNRINERTIGESAQGLARYVLQARQREETGSVKPGRIVIAYDTRHNSRPFAEVAASVVAANGLEAHLFEGPRATPELSFAVRHLSADAGIVISASHNPPADNGFKAYWKDGGQVVPPHDTAIIDEVVKSGDPARMDLGEAAKRGLYTVVGEDVDRAYTAYTAGLVFGDAKSLKIVLTPLHGTGTTSVAPALDAAGFTDVAHVGSQWDPDPDFSGVPNRSPNPENPAALEAGVREGGKTGADVVFGSDPDADRLGAMVRRRDEWVFLTGNQIGILLFDHIARSLAASGKIPRGAVLLKTCVTSDLLDRIAENHGIAVQGDYLVGFKYIAEAIQAMPDAGAFVFGIEESHGYLRGPQVRDKDAAQAAVLLAERAAQLKKDGLTLRDDLESIWSRYGYYVELTRSIALQGMGGGALAAKMMDALRADPPRELGGERIVAVADRKTGVIVDSASRKEIGKARGTPGNLLVFHLKEGGTERISIRPSGTEPKIKMYVQLRGEGSAAESATEKARAATDARAARLSAALEERTRRA
jgi:phosphomannomutase